ncbi:membrane protein [Microbacterium phage Honk]|uniref:Membrane protein n=1 Tax=Microbacterium phage Honk TaxID=2836095 RepID=A0A8F3IKB3_9CAUD|nr:membrane protein [Microbacterium phage Honk]
MSHRPARINPDSLGALVVSVTLTALLAGVSFLLSFNGLSDAATWANVPAWLAWGIPAYVDGAILVYTVAALIFRARGESARLAWASLALYASLSVAANGVHAWDAAPEELKAALGVVLAALAPVAVLLTTHTLARLIVAPPAAELVEEPAPVEVETFPSELPVEWLDEPVVVPRPEPEPEPEPVPARPAHEHIRALAKAHPELSIRAIAAEVGVSKSTVSRVLGRHPDEDTAAPSLAIA